MLYSPLLALSPLDGRYYEKMADLRPLFSEYGLIRFRIMFEIHWFKLVVQAQGINLNDDADKLLKAILPNFTEEDAQEIKNLEMQTNHDVKAIEYYLKRKIKDNEQLSKLCEFIHFACTSEDINNLSYATILQEARRTCILPTLKTITDELKKLAKDHANLPMLSRTHGQPASPTTLGKEMANVYIRLKRQIELYSQLPIMGKINGATGNFSAHMAALPNIDWVAISRQLITDFDLSLNEYTTQIEPHDNLAEMFMVLMRINSILIDFCRDVWGYIALNYFQIKSVDNEVGSSTMPHKINPIDFENAEGNLGLANALLHHMAAKLPISRWQRDLSDSTVLRNMGVAFGHSLLAYQAILKGLQKIIPNTDMLKQDLANHWEVLAEPIQTVMRAHGISESYEKLKNFTRGKKITKESLQAFIETLEIPPTEKNKLLALTPETYIGLASELAKKV